MKIKYKEPYWLKYKWDISNHHDNQYVTKHDKEENYIFNEFLHKDEYIITCNFKIKSHYKTDNICMVYGKPGKNFGLSYNTESKTLALEFWSLNEPDDKVHFVPFKTITEKDISRGVTVSVVRKNNTFILYKEFEEDNRYEFENNLVEDYKYDGLYVGCSSPDCETERQRYHGEMDVNHLSILTSTSNIYDAVDVCGNEPETLLNRRYYDNLICLFDFKSVNNLGIVYDESKYTNFLEKVPKEYIK